MNRYFKIPVLLLALAFVSCSDWLAVSPKSEKTEDDLFSTEAGFKSALTGAYIYTAAHELYGLNTTILFPESFTQHWARESSLHIPTSSNPVILKYYISQFEYENSYSESLFNTMWSKYYNCILQLNNVIRHIEDTDVSFQFDNDKLIHGEALGLRAFLHLDILRFFGPVPINADKSAPAIPYVEEVSRDPNTSVSVSYATVLEKILRDLNRAEELLNDADPVKSYLMYDLQTYSSNSSNRPEDEWQWDRQLRFNYYAVLATKARYYLWTGDKDNAAKYAEMVVKAEQGEDQPRFPLADELYYQQAAFNPHVFPGEIIFGVENSKHYTEVVETLFSFNSENNTVNLSRTLMHQDVTLLDDAYEEGISRDDIRYKGNRYWKTMGTTLENLFLKYGGPEESAPLNYIPIIRVAEMYLILIECLPIAQAKNYFEEYRIARNLNLSTQTNLDQTTRMERVEKEYRKEFYGEGQMFHYYKRHNVTTYHWPSAVTLRSDYYVLPKPEGQTMFE